MKRAFTLLELLVIIAIMGLMVTVGIVSVRSGQGAARVKGAARDVFATIRQARSIALVTQQPAIITYSTGEADGEVMAKVEITSARLMTQGVDRSKIRTITGEALSPLVAEDDNGLSNIGKADEDSKATADSGSKKGETLEDVLFAPIDENIVKGMRIKVLVGEGELEMSDDAPRPKASVFSNVDYLLGRYKDAKKSADAKKAEDAQTSASSGSNPVVEENQEPVSIVWETNGRVEPHKVWVYADGRRPETGLWIRVDRFGAAKVVSGDGREED